MSASAVRGVQARQLARVDFAGTTLLMLAPLGFCGIQPAVLAALLANDTCVT
jgi:hypothetical protein